MTRLVRTMKISAWARVDDDTKITFHVEPNLDTAEFGLGGTNGLCLEASEVGLRRLIAAGTDALGHFTAAAAAAELKAILPDHGVEPA